jgi:predicted RNase H-like HicB family nuclease
MGCKGEDSYGAFVPDLPGCVAAAESRAEVLVLIREAIEFHLEDLRESGKTVPLPHCDVTEVEVSHLRCATALAQQGLQERHEMPLPQIGIGSLQ